MLWSPFLPVWSFEVFSVFILWTGNTFIYLKELTKWHIVTCLPLLSSLLPAVVRSPFPEAINVIGFLWTCVCGLSLVWLFATPWTVACQAPLSMEFSRQEYWSGLPFPTPGDIPNPGIEPEFPASPELAGGFFTTVPPGKTFLWILLEI